VSWPLAGKHISFDGRFLHAAPSDLAGRLARLAAGEDAATLYGESASEEEEDDDDDDEEEDEEGGERRKRKNDPINERSINRI
jgi:hypothetical protein